MPDLGCLLYVLHPNKYSDHWINSVASQIINLYLWSIFSHNQIYFKQPMYPEAVPNFHENLVQQLFDFLVKIHITVSFKWHSCDCELFQLIRWSLQTSLNKYNSLFSMKAFQFFYWVCDQHCPRPTVTFTQSEPTLKLWSRNGATCWNSWTLHQTSSHKFSTITIYFSFTYFYFNPYLLWE